MGHREDEGGWHLLGMTGPDEYTGVVDDNVFTNLMAARNLRVAADLVPTAGSDFHGEKVAPGRSLGTASMPPELFAKLKARAASSAVEKRCDEDSVAFMRLSCMSASLS